MSGKHHAIFKEIHYKKKYEIGYKHLVASSQFPHRYYDYEYCTPFIQTDIVKDDTQDPSFIFEGELDKPELELSDSIYITNLEKVGQVVEKLRTTDNKIMYYLRITDREPNDDLENKEKVEAELALEIEEYNKNKEEEEEIKDTTPTYEEKTSFFEKIKKIFMWKE